MTGSPAPPVDVSTLAMDLSARGWTCSSFHVITRTGRPMWAVEGEREGHVLLCGFFQATVGGGRWSLSHCHLGRCLTDEELDSPLDPAMAHVRRDEVAVIAQMPSTWLDHWLAERLLGKGELA